jgi:hypothetical protein
VLSGDAMQKNVLAAALVLVAAACGTNKPEPTASNTKSSDASVSSATTTATKADAAAPAASGPPEKPFAGSAAEATSMISAVVDKKQDEIATCVREFRVRKKMAHDKVAVSFGIDQEGRLLGVTSKGREDAELKGCVQEVLKNATFPRSHSGVITVTKTYEEIIK